MNQMWMPDSEALPLFRLTGLFELDKPLIRSQNSWQSVPFSQLPLRQLAKDVVFRQHHLTLSLAVALLVHPRLMAVTPVHKLSFQ